MDIVFWGVLFFLATEREHQNEVTREYPIPAKMMEIGKRGNSEFKFKKKKKRTKIKIPSRKLYLGIFLAQRRGTVQPTMGQSNERAWKLEN